MMVNMFLKHTVLCSYVFQSLLKNDLSFDSCLLNCVFHEFSQLLETLVSEFWWKVFVTVNTLCRERGDKSPTVFPSVPQCELPVVLAFSPVSPNASRGFPLNYTLGCSRRQHCSPVLIRVLHQSKQAVCSLEATIMELVICTWTHQMLDKGNKKTSRVHVLLCWTPSLRCSQLLFFCR